MPELPTFDQVVNSCYRPSDGRMDHQLLLERLEERERFVRTRAIDLLAVLIADHSMWIDGDGEPLDYLPEREARITNLCREFAEGLS